jgi:hypothetical protein
MKYKILPYEVYEGLCPQCGDPVIDALFDGLFAMNSLCERHIPFRTKGMDHRSKLVVSGQQACPHGSNWMILDDQFAIVSCSRCAWWGEVALKFMRTRSEFVEHYLN